MDKLRKIITVICIAIVVGVTMPTVAFADSIGVAQGLFTSSEPVELKCSNTVTTGSKTLQDGFNNQKDPNNPEKSSIDQQTQINKDQADANKDNSDTFLSMIGTSILNVGKMLISDLFGINCGSFSFLSYFTNISNGVTITNNSVVMNIIGMTQLIALASSVIFIAFYAIIYASGNHKLNPMTFGIRMAVVLIAVWFAPYMMQDILNLNNILVTKISTAPLTSSVASAFQLAGVGIGATAIMSIGAILGVLVAFGPGDFLVGFAILALLIMIIKPVVKIIMWWYLRLLMIFMLAAVGPFFIVMLALPQTSRYFQNWLSSFLGQVFSQVFMNLGVLLFSDIMLNLWDFNQAVGISLFGDFILIYAMVNFMADLPEMASHLIGGGKTLGAGAIKDATNAVAGVLGSTMELGMKKMKENQKSQEFGEALQGQFKKNLGNIGGTIAKVATAAATGGVAPLVGAAMAKMGSKASIRDIGKGMLDTMNMNLATGNVGVGEQVKDMARHLTNKRMNEAMKNTSENPDGSKNYASTAEEALRQGAAIDPAWANSTDQNQKDQYDNWKNQLKTDSLNDSKDIMQDFQKGMGMSWNARSEISKLQNSGDLKTEDAINVLRTDAIHNGGLTDKRDIDNYVANAMEVSGLQADLGISKDALREAFTKADEIPGTTIGGTKIGGGARKNVDPSAGVPREKVALDDIKFNKRQIDRVDIKEL